MFDQIFVCLDGSPSAEKILPLAQGIAKAKGANLVLLRVVEDTSKIASEERYMRERAALFGGQIRFLVSPDPGAAIVGELAMNSGAIPALTTHGRTAWAEALFGSVALKLIRGAGRPVLVYRPLPHDMRAPAKISTVMIALDGNELSERILPFAVEIAKPLAARLLLVQVLRPGGQQTPPLREIKTDLLESSYLHAKAAEVRQEYDIEADWDVLHGEPGDAICRYISGMRDTLLAMTSHARGGLKRAVFGSVAAECIRNGGAPMLIYWPHSEVGSREA